MIEIKDNFLDKTLFLKIKNLMIDSYMPWFFNNEINEVNNKDYYFTHLFVNDNKSVSSLSKDIIAPLMNNINHKKILKAKANLFLKQNINTEYGFHTDYPKDFKHTTILFAINTNNGYTEFEDGTKIESIENRLIIFDGQLTHQSVGQTDTKQRINLNINIEE